MLGDIDSDIALYFLVKGSLRIDEAKYIHIPLKRKKSSEVILTTLDPPSDAEAAQSQSAAGGAGAGDGIQHRDSSRVIADDSKFLCLTDGGVLVRELCAVGACMLPFF